jgi:ADP-glucose pyrophosphorylase
VLYIAEIDTVKQYIDTNICLLQSRQGIINFYYIIGRHRAIKPLLG